MPYSYAMPDVQLPGSLNPLNAELNPICHLLALRGGATIVVVSRLRVKTKTTSISQVSFHNDMTRTLDTDALQL